MKDTTIKTTMTRAKIFIGETAPQVGIEPTTNWLTANCSTAELLWNTNYSLTKNVIVKWRIKIPSCKKFFFVVPPDATPSRFVSLRTPCYGQTRSALHNKNIHWPILFNNLTNQQKILSRQQPNLSDF